MKPENPPEAQQQETGSDSESGPDEIARRDSLIILKGLEKMASDNEADSDSDEEEFDLSKLIQEQSSRLSISRSKASPSPISAVDDPTDGPNASRACSATPSPLPPPSDKPVPDARTLSLAVDDADDNNEQANDRPSVQTTTLSLAKEEDGEDNGTFTAQLQTPASPKPVWFRSNGRPIPTTAHDFMHSNSKERYEQNYEEPTETLVHKSTDEGGTKKKDDGRVDLRHCCSDASYKSNSTPNSPKPVTGVPTAAEIAAQADPESQSTLTLDGIRLSKLLLT